ncbi:HNH endonuclease [Arthrobacter bambusae]|uniref:HNH endonuclease signature motif containing protein n=1 Tax=Arthrobacter TaxID=1663 RepID=UPI001F514CCF|nr:MULTISPECIES: HNH endonuclease signature motif containing protein [Arthrobacter]MCI0141042.1 HNH endonuclease [Arthrobacter bambusae]UYY80041.1 HNH endonuclease [Arthrobacter sp. YA7-1]
MDGKTAWSAESRAAVEAVAASVAVLAAFAQDAGPSERPDPLRDLADGCLDGLAEVARLEARTAALKAKLAADYVQAASALAPPASSPQESTAQELALIAEVACVLTVSERTAGGLLVESRSLTTTLPLTLKALQSGTISWQHARIIVDETSGLGPAGAAALEAHFLDPDAPNPARGCPAGALVPSRFRAKARTWRERHHPVSIESRHAKSAEDRRVEYLPDRDGMAWLSAYLPAATAAGIWERTTAAARALQGPDEPRTLAQLRADITATWLLTNTTGGVPDGGLAGVVPDGGLPGVVPDGGLAGGGRAEPGLTGRVPSPRAQVLVTVPILSLLGVTEEPAMLDGYGPIPPSMARSLIADGADSFHRVLIDPRDGAPLEIGRTSYRLTKAQRQWLRLRDGKCPFPGCNNHSLDNDADHLLAWADGGTTGITNLGQPCPKHHRLRHRTGWTPSPASKDHPPGWTSPSKRHYPSEQQDWEPPRWPHHFTIIDTDLDTGAPPGHELPAHPEFPRDPELPQDPFPDWCSFTAAHPWPDPDDMDVDHGPVDPGDPDRPVRLNDPYPECPEFQTA